MSRKLSDFIPEIKGRGGLVYDYEDVDVTVQINASSVDQFVWVAAYPGQVVAVREVHAVAGGSGAAVRLRKVTDTSAPGAAASATVKEVTQAAFDLTAAANTTQTAATVADASPVNTSDRYFARGDKLALDFSGTLTGLVGIVSIHIKRMG